MRSCFFWSELRILGEKSWCHWNSLPWTLHEFVFVFVPVFEKVWEFPQGPKVSNIADEGFSLLPLHIPCLVSQPLNWSSVFPFTTHIYLPFSYFPPEQPIFPWQESFLFTPGPVIYDVNCALCLFFSTRFALYQLKNFLQNTWNLKSSA